MLPVDLYDLMCFERFINPGTAFVQFLRYRVTANNVYRKLISLTFSLEILLRWMYNKMLIPWIQHYVLNGYIKVVTIRRQFTCLLNVVVLKSASSLYKVDFCCVLEIQISNWNQEKGYFGMVIFILLRKIIFTSAKQDWFGIFHVKMLLVVC